VGHLSKSVYLEMKRQHQGQALAESLADWIEQKKNG
jgi:hypothetical protein